MKKLFLVGTTALFLASPFAFAADEAASNMQNQASEQQMQLSDATPAAGTETKANDQAMEKSQHHKKTHHHKIASKNHHHKQKQEEAKESKEAM